MVGKRHRNHNTLAHTARKLVRVGLQPLFCFGDAHILEQLQSFFFQFVRLDIGVMHPNHLCHLLAHRNQRVQAGHRVLEYHRNFLPADFPHLTVADLGQVGALKFHLAAFDARGVRQQTQHRHRGHAFAAAALAHDAQNFTLMHRKADTAHSLYFSGRGHKRGLQVLDP